MKITDPSLQGIVSKCCWSVLGYFSANCRNFWLELERVNGGTGLSLKGVFGFQLLQTLDASGYLNDTSQGIVLLSEDYKNSLISLNRSSRFMWSHLSKPPGLMSTRAALSQYHETVLEMQENKSPLSQWDFAAWPKPWCSTLSYVLDDKNKNKGRADVRRYTSIQNTPDFITPKKIAVSLKWNS